MKISKGMLNTNLEFFKSFKEKQQLIDLEIKDELFSMKAKGPNDILIIKNFKVENEKDTGNVTIEKSWLERINNQKVKDDEAITIRINKRSVTTNLNKINFKTALIGEASVNIQEESPEVKPIIFTKEMIEALKLAAEFTSTNLKARPILTGVNVRVENNELTITATDGFKMIKRTFNVETEIKVEVTLLKDTIEVIESLSKGAKGIPITFTQTNVYVVGKSVYYSARTLSGAYPNVSSIIKTANEKETIATIHMTKENLDRLKSIRLKGQPYLEIKIEKDQNIFKISDEIMENELVIEAENNKEHLIRGELNNLITAFETYQELEVKSDIFIVKKEDLYLAVMALRSNP